MPCVKRLGTFSSCQDIHTGVFVGETSNYFIGLRTSSGNISFSKTMYSGEEIVIPARRLNESSKVIMSVNINDNFLKPILYNVHWEKYNENLFEFEIIIEKNIYLE